ncbi:MAG: O-antigen ligase family protein, partial [Candidatus Sericytochromatia bacterium]|nr:O-antigen ligase family protein [Candidatus Sericytochromatia bacterium]
MFKPLVYLSTFTLSLISLLPLFIPDSLIYVLGFYGIITLLVLVLKKDFALNLVFLFIFAGTLFSLDIGFTFKTSQFFVLITILSMLISYLNGNDNFNKFSWREYFPFILYILLILPSLCTPLFFSEDYETVDSLKILFNYLFLQLICFVISLNLTNRSKIYNAIKYSFFSYILVLIFGILQQIGYYSGFYDPNDYLGNHSLFVDFYGPFLRISPGTFANEFGEIIQSILIFISTYLIFMKKELNLKNKFLLKSTLFISILALIINFTRASWIAYIFYLICIFFISKPKIKTKALIIGIVSIFVLSVYYINLETNILSVVPILDRISELSDLSDSSAGSRLETWEISYNLFLNKPLIGNGLGVATVTHNVPLQLLAETGIIGFLGFYFLMFYLLHKFYRMSKLTKDNFLKTTSISVFFIIIGCLVFDFTNHGIYHFVLWLSIGIGLATEKVIKQI